MTWQPIRSRSFGRCAWPVSRRAGLEGDLPEPVGFAATAFPKVKPAGAAIVSPSPQHPDPGYTAWLFWRWELATLPPNQIPSSIGTTASTVTTG